MVCFPYYSGVPVTSSSIYTQALRHHYRVFWGLGWGRLGSGDTVPSARVLTVHLVVQVLQQMPSPTGPQLHLSPTFASRDNQDKLEQFIRQFICS